MRQSPYWFAIVGASALLACPAERLAAQQTHNRIVTGVVIGSITQSPVSGAIILVEGGYAGAVSDERGRFMLRDVPSSAAVLRAQYIGYRPVRLPLEAGSDSVDVALALGEPRPHSPVTGALPPLSLYDVHAIWAVLLDALTFRAEATVSHLQEVSRAVPRAGIPAPTGSAGVVLWITPGSSPALEDSTWQSELLAAHLIDGVCHSLEVSACPQVGFRLFLTPSPPGRFATDSVTVAITYTALDAQECKRGRGTGDTGSEAHLVVRQGDQWRNAGPDDFVGSLIGGVYCGSIR